MVWQEMEKQIKKALSPKLDLEKKLKKIEVDRDKLNSRYDQANKEIKTLESKLNDLKTVNKELTLTKGKLEYKLNNPDDKLAKELRKKILALKCGQRFALLQ